MRAAGAGLIAAVLALAGCKSADQKGDTTRPFAGMAGLKGKDAKDKDKDKEAKGGPTGLSWLEDGRLPGAGTSVPKGPADPRAAKADAQDALGGRVLDPAGKPARNVFVRIDRVGAPANDPAAVGIYTNNEGYFFTRGFKAGQAYDLVAEATQQDGKPLVGVVQTTVPKVTLLIVLRDDLPGPAGGLPAPKGPDGGTFPPDPRPSDKVGEAVPPRPAPKSSDGAWSPGGSITGVPPATIGNSGAPKSPAPGGGIPPPADLTEFPAPRPVRPESTADGPKDPFKPPAVNIPGPAGPPAVPPLPALPPSFGPTGGGRSSQNNATTAGNSASKLVLLDTLERSWELESVPPGSLVLVEFISSTCVPCKKAVPVLKDVQSRYGASGLQVAAVMCDDVSQKERAALAAQYGRDMNLNYAVYVEPGAAGSVRDRYGVETYPTAVLLNPAGKVLWKGHPGAKAELESAIKRHLGK